MNIEDLRAKLERVALALSEVPLGMFPSVELGLGLDISQQLLALGGAERRNTPGVADVDVTIGGVTFCAQYATHTLSALDADARALGDAP